MVDSRKIFCIFFSILVLGGCASQMERGGSISGTASGSASVKPNDADAFYQLGRSYQEKEQYPEAIGAYERALEFNADHVDAYNGMGVVYSILGEHELAIRLIGKAVKLAPLASYLHNNLGYAYLEHGLASEAAGAFQRALKLDPDNVNARNNLSAAYKAMGCTENQSCGQWQEPPQAQ